MLSLFSWRNVDFHRLATIRYAGSQVQIYYQIQCKSFLYQSEICTTQILKQLYHFLHATVHAKALFQISCENWPKLFLMLYLFQLISVVLFFWIRQELNVEGTKLASENVYKTNLKIHWLKEKTTCIQICLVLKTKLCILIYTIQSQCTEDVCSKASIYMMTWNIRTPTLSKKQTSLLFCSTVGFLHFFQVFTNWYKVNLKKILDWKFSHLLQGGYRLLKVICCLHKLFC